jgi:hypothetical protein
MAMCEPAPAPLATASGSGAQHEGERGHQDRTQAFLGGNNRGIDQFASVIIAFAGEFDDQEIAFLVASTVVSRPTWK